MDVVSAHHARGEFFKILAQTDKSQVGVMTIAPKGDSGPEEIHTGDQIVYIIDGEARVAVHGEELRMTKGDVAIIPKGARHHIYNDADTELFFLTVYTPPQY